LNWLRPGLWEVTNTNDDDKEIKMPRQTKTSGLGSSGTALFTSIDDHYELEVHERLLLVEACRTADRLNAIADALASAPLTVTNARGDEAAQPLLSEARQQQLVLARLIASLRLPSGEADERPQRRGAARGSYGLQAVSR